jgi:type I restriction enzyme S subunit
VQGHLSEVEDNWDSEHSLRELKKLRLESCSSKSEADRISEEFERTIREWRETHTQPRLIRTLCACHFITKGTTPAANDLLPRGEVPFLKVYNIVDNKLDFAYRPSFISRTTHTGALARSIVKPGDVIMNIVGPPLGKVALVTDEYGEWNINQALAFFRPLPLFSNRFLALVLSAPITIQEVLKETRGTVGQDNLSLEQVRNLRIPFISLHQQHRIVAKVSEMMALSDRLEANLTAADVTRRRLLDALLAEALAPAERELEAAECAACSRRARLL